MVYVSVVDIGCPGVGGCHNLIVSYSRLLWFCYSVNGICQRMY